MAAKAVANTMRTSLGPNGRRLSFCFLTNVVNYGQLLQPLYKVGMWGGGILGPQH